MSKETLEVHKQIYDFLSMPRRNMSVVIESIPLDQRDWLFNAFSGINNAIVIDEEEFDIATFFDMEDFALPLPYLQCCDELTPLTPDGDYMKMQTYAPVRTGSNFQVKKCDPRRDKRMLTELRGMLAASGRVMSGMTPRELLNAYIQGMYAKQRARLRRTEVLQGTQALIYGKASTGGPTIKPGDDYIDYKRDKKLTATVPANQFWNNPKADVCGQLIHCKQMIRDLTIDQADVTDIVFTPTAWKFFKKNNKWTDKSCKCPPGREKVVNDYYIDLTPEAPKPRGLRAVQVEIDDSDNTQFWVYDEQHAVVYEDPATGEKSKVRENVLPDGAVLLIARNNIRPLSLYGAVEYLGDPPAEGQPIGTDTVLEGRRVFANRWRSPDGRCWNFDLESVFLHGYRQPNATKLLFPIDPETCPRPDYVCPVEMECEETK